LHAGVPVVEKVAMIVIERHGRTTVITGWRAWLIGLAGFAAASLLIALIFFVFLGVAVTLGAILLVVLPALVVIADAGARNARNHQPPGRGLCNAAAMTP
jgi:hypothetical protein